MIKLTIKRRMSVLLLLIFMFVYTILFSSVAFASANWFREGNSGIRLPGSQGGILYGSNILNQVTDTTYTQCTASVSSTKNPVVFDYNGDGIQELLIPTSSTIEIFGLDCRPIETVSIVDSIVSAPYVTNIDADSFQEFGYINNSGLVFYEYDTISQTMKLKTYIDYKAELGAFQGEASVCSRDESGSGVWCAVVWSSGNKYSIYNLTTTTWSTFATITDIVDTYRDVRNGLSYTYIDNLGQYYLGIVNSDIGTDNDMEINIMDVEGNELCHEVLFPSSSGNIDQTYQAGSHFAKVGGVWRIMNYAIIRKGGVKWSHNTMLDTACNVLYDSTHLSGDIVSNWMVGDYDKSGSSEACILSNNTDDIFCLGSDGVVDYTISVTGTNYSASLVIADFNYSDSRLCFGSKESIFCDGNQLIDNNQTIHPTNDIFYNGIVVSVGATGTPAYIYTDTTGLFITANSLSLSSCGNGDCEDWENSFTCAEDCLEATPTPIVECIINSQCPSGSVCLSNLCTSNTGCTSSDQCPTNYPLCIFNNCVRGIGDEENISDFNFSCVFNVDCPSELPVCYNGLCVAGVSGVAGSETEADNDIDLFIKTLFGDNTIIKFIVGMAMVLGIMIIIGEMTGFNKDGFMVMGVGGIFMLIIVTVLGLVPIYVLVLLILSGIGIGVLFGFLMRGNS